MNTKDLLTFSQLKGLGKATLRKMMQITVDQGTQFQSPADYTNFLSLLKAHYTFANKFDYGSLAIARAADRADEIYAKSAPLSISIISQLDPQFPLKLRTLSKEKGIDDSPLIIHYRGNIGDLSKPTLAIAGTRHPTKDGMLATSYFSDYFSNEGFNIVSGLAKGCDTIAHQQALCNGNSTTAVLAHGLDEVYPVANCRLLQDIIQAGGLVISEYPVGTSPIPSNFIERDKIQAASADAVLVIQSKAKSGTMHTAHTALLNNKVLVVVAYDTTSPQIYDGNEILLSNHKALALTSKNKQQVAAQIYSNIDTNLNLSIDNKLF